MKRRSVLRQLGSVGAIGLSGCVSPPTEGTDTQTSSTASQNEQRRVSIAKQDSLSDEYQLQIEAQMLETAITDSQTARIRVTITNHGPARGIPVSKGRCALFNRYSQTSNPRGVVLGLADDSVYITQTGPQWVAEPPKNGAFPDYGCALRTYEPGESVAVDYGIFHDNRTGDYLDSGTYRFVEDDILITPSPSAERDSESSISFSWGFLINIENPNCTICF